jgi:DNA-binding transcriptional regulator YhcF (GntR family)
METTESIFRVDRDSDLPVGIQLSWRLRSMIASGKLAPGDRLPSVRDLASDAGVNANTVRAIYGRLEADAVLETVHGLGTFVAQGASSSTEVERIAADAVAEARREGISPSDVARAIYAAGWAGDDAPTSDRELPDVGVEADEAAARRELRRQIARLEAELAAYPEARSDSNTHPLLRPKGHLPTFAELSVTRDELMDRLKKARTKAERKGERQARAHSRREQIIGDPEAHRWERVGNEECGDPGCGETRAVPRFGPIGRVMSWWRVKVSSGCPLAEPLAAAPT